MMFIPIISIVKNVDQSWTFTWANLSQTISRVILWGTELISTTDFSYTWRGSEYTTFPPPLEITDETLSDSETYLPYMVIQWYGDPAVQNYKVQQSLDNGATYQTIQEITETGEWIYTYVTVTQFDEVEYLYRVVSVDSVGNLSQPRFYSRYVVCPPAPPGSTIQISYSNPNVVISGT